MGKSVEVANDIEGGRRTVTETPRSHRHGNGSKMFKSMISIQ